MIFLRSKYLSKFIYPGATRWWHQDIECRIGFCTRNLPGASLWCDLAGRTWISIFWHSVPGATTFRFVQPGATGYSALRPVSAISVFIIYLCIISLRFNIHLFFEILTSFETNNIAFLKCIQKIWELGTKYVHWNGHCL